MMGNEMICDDIKRKPGIGHQVVENGLICKALAGKALANFWILFYNIHFPTGLACLTSRAI